MFFPQIQGNMSTLRNHHLPYLLLARCSIHVTRYLLKKSRGNQTRIVDPSYVPDKSSKINYLTRSCRSKDWWKHHNQVHTMIRKYRFLSRKLLFFFFCWTVLQGVGGWMMWTLDFILWMFQSTGDGGKSTKIALLNSLNRGQITKYIFYGFMTRLYIHQVRLSSMAWMIGIVNWFYFTSIQSDLVRLYKL